MRSKEYVTDLSMGGLFMSLNFPTGNRISENIKNTHVLLDTHIHVHVCIETHAHIRVTRSQNSQPLLRVGFHEIAPDRDKVKVFFLFPNEV